MYFYLTIKSGTGFPEHISHPSILAKFLISIYICLSFITLCFNFPLLFSYFFTETYSTDTKMVNIPAHDHHQHVTMDIFNSGSHILYNFISFHHIYLSCMVSQSSAIEKVSIYILQITDNFGRSSYFYNISMFELQYFDFRCNMFSDWLKLFCLSAHKHNFVMLL